MTTPKPLRGKRVIEFSQFIAGPTAGQLLADFGAEVIKIEPPAGDGSRALVGNAFGSVYFRSFNTNKTSRVLDMRSDKDLEAFHKLLSNADALVCNVAPPTLRRLGLDADALKQRHPHLVVTLVSGFGQQDDRTCMDTIAQCESGFAWLNGTKEGEPRISTSWPVDFFSGLYAAFSTAMALADRERENGVLVDISMMEVAASMLLGPSGLFASEGHAPSPPTGNADRASAPSNIYRCKDGYVYIYGGLDNYWSKLRKLVGGEQSSMSERFADAEHYDALVEAWTAQRSRDEVLEAMAAAAIPAGAIRHPSEAVEIIRGYRNGAVAQRLDSGEHVPSYPALFSGERIQRECAPNLK
jgi:crotonobetainyl-CoA:carnitine CoA-transferase CaiB-like acyl-CoA transferase